MKILFFWLLLFSAVTHAASELEMLLLMLKENEVISSDQYRRVIAEYKQNQQLI